MKSMTTSLHLDQEGLKPAQGRALARANARQGDHGSDIAQGIAPRGIKDETVDGSPEIGRGSKGDENNQCSDQ